jgi:hypothetical protein
LYTQQYFHPTENDSAKINKKALPCVTLRMRLHGPRGSPSGDKHGDGFRCEPAGGTSRARGRDQRGLGGAAQAGASDAGGRLTDKRIKEAVGATIAAAPDKDSVPANQQDALRAPMLSAEQYKKFEKEFAYAKVPYCLGDEGLKFQPPRIGFISFSGLLAVPFVLVAAARGKCK